MAWDDGLLPEQKEAARYTGTHARLLAGPGTGKTLTLTRRICYLVEHDNIAHDKILALTFTRAAAHELRQRVENELGTERVPHISTLHSFALRQLMRNSRRITVLPQPLRIADDWEERNIILEDLKQLLQLQRISDARDLLNELSADWQRLTTDEDDWESRFPNPRFLGAWREHRKIYGYVLRSELVYQLKLALEQDPEFSIEGEPNHLLLDEYQDLNRCDLAVAKAISNRGAETYCAGDDDQSIYGFRLAHPEGIRRFPDDYRPSEPLELQICKRCDPNILDLALFVARQDHRRLEKPLRAEDGRSGGEVALLRFSDQNEEAASVAALCSHLVNTEGLSPEDILILVRSDRYSAFSSLINSFLGRVGLDSSVATSESDPLDEKFGRQVLCLLRILENTSDHLAWRALIKLRDNRLGDSAISAMYDLAVAQGLTFSQALNAVSADPSITQKCGSRLRSECVSILQTVETLRVAEPQDGTRRTNEELLVALERIVHSVTTTPQEMASIHARFAAILASTQPGSLGRLAHSIEVSDNEIEQEIEIGKINILTMHKAKGLTAKAVIIIAAEDEYLPGRAEGDQIGDERRLLYVSLTRAKHHLFITYCRDRTGQQRHTGRTSGETQRTLSQFLSGAPISPTNGADFIRSLGRGRH